LSTSETENCKSQMQCESKIENHNSQMKRESKIQNRKYQIENQSSPWFSWWQGEDDEWDPSREATSTTSTPLAIIRDSQSLTEEVEEKRDW